MKQLLITWFILVFVQQTDAQSIYLDQLDKEFKSYLPKSEQLFIDSVLNHEAFTISLVSLKPQCDSPNDCYESTVILDDYNWDTPVEDPSFGDLFVERIMTERFDSIVPLDSADYEPVVSNVLFGESLEDAILVRDICYNPRHAIIFQNKEEKILGVYEVCFECRKSKIGFHRTEYIEGDSTIISDLFIRYGLKNE